MGTHIGEFFVPVIFPHTTSFLRLNTGGDGFEYALVPVFEPGEDVPMTPLHEGEDTTTIRRARSRRRTPARRSTTDLFP